MAEEPSHVGWSVRHPIFQVAVVTALHFRLRIRPFNTARHGRATFAPLAENECCGGEKRTR
jgi:hypothetical protein